ncbi:hypothetical protein V6N00_13150 [Tersicoccus sp. MR15.9]|uniref:hypothetical protein n=1 Tax=Tersicoccus mangrovi TaxID=3121635 RepID=UPI002FE61BA5
MSDYARTTTVTVEASRAEIEKALRRYGATGFSYGWSETRAQVQFEANGRRIRFALAMPDPNERRFTHTPSRDLRRTRAETEKAYEQATRQIWRALVLVIKAKLEAVQSGIVTFEQEFLAHIVMPDGSTVSEYIAPAIESIYEGGQVPPLLGLPPGR